VRVYLLANEITADDSEGESLRLDVTDNTPAEREAILAQARLVMEGIPCTWRWEQCRHDEHKPCSMVEIV